MTFIISFLATKLSYSSDRLVKAESRRRVAAISHSLTATSDDAKRVFAKAKALLAREDATTGMYEITGTKLKPIAWGDEAVLLDMEYLNDVPPDVAPLLVAERVAQTLEKRNTSEERAFAGSLGFGVLTGACVVNWRLGLPGTLRRAYTLGVLGAAAAAYALTRSPAFSDGSLGLKRMLQCVGEAATVPDFDRASAFAQLLAFEQAKLDDTYKRAQELRDHAEAGEVAVSEPGRPPAGVAAMAVQLEMKDAQHRVETVREFLRQRA